MMVRTALASLFLLAALVAAPRADEKKEAHKDDSKSANFERFKLLAGEWVGKFSEGDGKGMDAVVRYKVTSGGTTVVETMAPDSQHEMVTVIHPDGDDLALTHYCMIGNQPRMKAAGKSDGNKVAFKFVSASNMKSDQDMHMHEVVFTFIDKDTLKTEWTNYNEGKAAGTAVFELKRKKQVEPGVKERKKQVEPGSKAGK